MPCHASCHAMPCHATLCHAMHEISMPCHAPPCQPHHATPCHALCHAPPCHALCHAPPCHAMPCPTTQTCINNDGKQGLRTSSLVRSRTYLAGLPAHSWPEGIRRPGGSTLPGASTAGRRRDGASDAQPCAGSAGRHMHWTQHSHIGAASHSYECQQSSRPLPQPSQLCLVLPLQLN